MVQGGKYLSGSFHVTPHKGDHGGLVSSQFRTDLQNPTLTRTSLFMSSGYPRVRVTDSSTDYSADCHR